MITPEDILEENGYSIEDLQDSETILFRNPDYATAIIGVTEDYKVVYDYEKMVEYLMCEDEMTYEEAADMINYNTIRSLPYIPGNKPIIMFPFN